ncbi:MAG TPA: GDSL-type esterase/lipase family protein [Acidimicrobiales bacterium]|nr:GDSL-type esterase/lipase family protein [Acidimicrobiales bacterium]
MYPQPRRRITAIGAAFATALALVFSSLTVLGFASSASAATTDVFYLDIGASVSVGVQPTPTAPQGRPTDRGYANRLVSLEAAKGVTLHLTELGCPGESTTTMITGGDRCYQAPDNQLTDAVTYLQAHHDQTGLVTLDLGFNDIVACLRGASVDMTCVNQNLALLARQLPQIISTLKAAAGPNVTFIGLNHYNPYTARALLGAKGIQFAQDSTAVLRQLNDLLQQIYASYAVPMANVVRAFNSDARQGSKSRFMRSMPINVQEACNLTWMCRSGHYGPNLHPNNAGYEAITDAIATLLPKW